MSLSGRGLQAAAAIAVAAGAALTAWLVAHFGWRPVAGALAALGPGGFALFCGYTLAVFALLGLSWFVLAPGLPWRLLPAFVFGRLVREAGADILPLAQLGGFVMGARAATLLGLGAVVALASSIVDLATEMIGQLLFTAVGAAAIGRDAPRTFPHRWLDPPLWIGLAVGGAAAAAFLTLQRADWGFLDRFAARWPAAQRHHLDAVRGALRKLHARPAWVVASTLLHVLAWLAASGGVWLVLHGMGAALTYERVIMLEALIYLLRSAAFFVPGALGVLEGGYILLGPVFGLSAETALSLSLVKRARDIAIGAPAIVAWQILEGCRFWRRATAVEVS